MMVPSRPYVPKIARIRKDWDFVAWCFEYLSGLEHQKNIAQPLARMLDAYFDFHMGILSPDEFCREMNRVLYEISYEVDVCRIEPRDAPHSRSLFIVADRKFERGFEVKVEFPLLATHRWTALNEFLFRRKHEKHIKSLPKRASRARRGR
jgi:hypothetical protein